VQQSNNAVEDMDGAGDNQYSNQSGIFTQTIAQAASNASLTDSGSGSYSNYAGGSFAFACLAYNSGASDSLSETVSTSSTSILSAASTVGPPACP
jgi:hypothetical protein